MPWFDLNFGKHSGRSLPEVIFKDADWFFWAGNAGVFNNRGAFLEQAQSIWQRATAIRIPEAFSGHVAQYVVNRPTGLLQEMILIPAESHRYEHAYYTEDHIDLSVPRWLKDYDKRGFKQIIRDLKFYLFGNTSARMSKQRCEDFFSDDNNFVL